MQPQRIFVIIELDHSARVRKATSDEILIAVNPLWGENTLAVEEDDGELHPILVVDEETDHPDYCNL